MHIARCSFSRGAAKGVAVHSGSSSSSHWRQQLRALQNELVQCLRSLVDVWHFVGLAGAPAAVADAQQEQFSRSCMHCTSTTSQRFWLLRTGDNLFVGRRLLLSLAQH